MNRLVTSLIVSLLLVYTQSAVAAPFVFLQDDFSGPVLDATKWNVVTADIPQGSASVTQTGGHVELVNRGFLNTVEQFKPDDPAVGGLRITGQWTFTNALDYLEIVTRSSGTPSGAFGEASGGIEFHVNNEHPTAQILLLRDGQPTEILGESAGMLSNTAFGTFNFVITDDGTNLSFSVAEVGNPANSAFVSTVFPMSFATNFVTFHNRENRFFQSNVALLDDVRIESLTRVPEPGGLLLLILGGAGLLWRRQQEA